MQSCLAPAGWGLNYSLTFFGTVTGGIPFTRGATVKNVVSYALPTIKQVSVLTGGSSISSSALPLRVAGNLSA